MGILRIFKTSTCGACATEVPRIQEIGHKLGMSVRVIDVDHCPVSLKPRCEAVDFVPHLELDGRAISVQQLESMSPNR